MASDEFDPELERAFSSVPRRADTPLFVAELEARLHRGARVRAVGLGLAGLAGGVVALRELLGFNLTFESEAMSARSLVDRNVTTDLAANAQAALQTRLEHWGLSDLAFAGMGGMPMFWIVAGVVVVLAVTTVMRLSQEV